MGAAVAPLADAAETMDRESIRALLQQSADVNESQADGMTALHWAARHNDLEIAQLLVRSGAGVNTPTRYGVTPLTLACTNGNQRLVELLLEAGADPNTTLPGGETALMTAARTGRLGPVKALLARGADLQATVRGKGRREEPGDIVVAAAFDPSIRDYEIKAEQTALDVGGRRRSPAGRGGTHSGGCRFPDHSRIGVYTVAFCHQGGPHGGGENPGQSGCECKTRLLSPRRPGSVAGTTTASAPGATPLLVAVENAHFELATYLLEVGADPNAGEPTGYTALHAIVSARRSVGGNANPPSPRLWKNDRP